jgi:hypothetical protein
LRAAIAATESHTKNGLRAAVFTTAAVYGGSDAR